MDAGRITAIIHASSEKIMAAAHIPSASSTVVSRSPWHSPVPYLFGGMAVMLVLIALALLILGCSYWQLADILEENERDLEAGEGTGEDRDEEMKKMAMPVFEEKFLVILAGQQNPTCLATPMWSRASYFGSTVTAGKCTCNHDDETKEEESKTNPRQAGTTNQA